MASFAFDSYLDNVLAGNILKTDTYYGMLTTSAYTPGQGTNVYRSDVTNEVTGTGYTAGGQAVVPTFAKDSTNHKETITIPAMSWASSTITARHLVIYKHRGGAATADELVCQIDFGADVSSSNGTFTVNASTITLNTPA